MRISAYTSSRNVIVKIIKSVLKIVIFQQILVNHSNTKLYQNRCIILYFILAYKQSKRGPRHGCRLAHDVVTSIGVIFITNSIKIRPAVLELKYVDERTDKDDHPYMHCFTFRCQEERETRNQASFVDLKRLRG